MACKLAEKAGMSGADIAKEFPRVWRVDKDGSLFQIYDSIFVDHGVKETRMMILESVVNTIIIKRGGDPT